MPRLSFILVDGTRRDVKAAVGCSAMQGAVGASIPGIDADCGGACACGTCHVYVTEAWAERVGPPSQMEADMLECTDNPRSSSRLSCQITMQNALDGLILVIPPKA